MGTIGRLVGNAMGTDCNYQLIYVDDLHVVVFGERKFLTLWMMLAAYEALGTPFQYAKFAGGIEVTFVCFQLDYGRCKMGVTAKRGLWLLNFIKELEEARYTVHMRGFGRHVSEWQGRCMKNSLKSCCCTAVSTQVSRPLFLSPAPVPPLNWPRPLPVHVCTPTQSPPIGNLCVKWQARNRSVYLWVK